MTTDYVLPGEGEGDGGILNQAEIYAPASDRWALTEPMQAGRYVFQLVELSNGTCMRNGKRYRIPDRRRHTLLPGYHIWWDFNRIPGFSAGGNYIWYILLSRTVCSRMLGTRGQHYSNC